ncbi:trypsin-like serine peptidase [Streptomyces sp. NPDC007264]|uniref:trypsin-like serine peptidase n=1 Tax=Streptomyces sp. NPDC007264 TaxID=3364777 RepID=UPI0036DDF3E6
MNRITRHSGNRGHAFLSTVVLLAVTTSSVAAADRGAGPLGETVRTRLTSASSRIGPLFGTSGGLEGGHFCTASVVHSRHRDLIVTAAHCLGGGPLWFAPGYRDGRAPYGVWKVTRTYVGDAWSDDQDENSDVAFATLAPVDGARIEDVVGANRFAAGRRTGATPLTVTGYPSSRETPISCVNRPTASSPRQQRIECPGFTSGTSGSPWVNGFGELVGVLGGHEQGGDTPGVSYSVVLGNEAAALYRTASGA